jgi:hypothetical protein
MGGAQRGGLGVPEGAHLSVCLAPSGQPAPPRRGRRAGQPPGRIWNSLRKPQKDLFWYERNWEEFERVFERYRRADLSKADPKAVAGIVAIDKWMTRNQQAIELVLTSPHWPRDLTPLEEHLHTVQSRLGDRRRLFRNPYRLTCA